MKVSWCYLIGFQLSFRCRSQYPSGKKTSSIRIGINIMWWLSNLLTGQVQRVLVNKVMWPVISGIPQGSILVPVLFYVFMNDLDTGLGILTKFADDTKLWEAVDFLEGKKALQRDLDKLEGWAIIKYMKIFKSNCEILHLERGNPSCTCRVGDVTLKSSHAEMDLGLLIDSGLRMSNSLLGRPAVSWAASSMALLACWRKWLSFSTLHWCCLTLNSVCSFGHHHSTRT